MSDVAPTGAEAPSAPIPVGPALDGPTTVRDAGNAISAWRAKQAEAAEPEKKEQPRDRGRFAPAPATESAPLEGADADAEKPPGEDHGDDPALEPSIDPPRSWSAEDKEAFKLLPPERQQSIVERERTRDADIRRRQNEVAEQTKGLTAKEQAAEQARQHYERQAQSALQILQTQTANEFPDIKTQADVVALATSDPFRAVQFQARQQQLAALHQEVQQAEHQRQQDSEARFKAWSKEQDDAFTKQFPEFADPEKGPKARTRVLSYLKEVGVPEDRVQGLWGNELFRDAMFQRIVNEASLFNAGQKKAQAATKQPLPPVQRPGSTSARGSGAQEDVASLTTQLKSAKGVNAAEIAASLMAAKRRAAARR